MLAHFYILRLSNDMKLAVPKNHLGRQILYRNLDPAKKRRQTYFQAVYYIGSLSAVMAAIPVMFFVRHLRYKNRLKLEVENPNENFVKFGESISDEIDQKRFRALYLPSVVISKGKSRSDLLGEGYYGRVVKVRLQPKVFEILVKIEKKIEIFNEN